MTEHQNLDEELAVLKSYITQCETELKSLTVAKKKSAAPRIRKSLQQIKNHSHKMRGSVTESVKSMPTKSRAKKEPVQVLDAKMSQAEAEPEPEIEPVEPVKKVRKPRVKKVAAE